MTGKQILDRIEEMHKEYVASDNDNDPQPTLCLSVQMSYKLIEVISPASRHFSQLISMAQGDTNSFNMLSVKLWRVK